MSFSKIAFYAQSQLLLRIQYGTLQEILGGERDIYRTFYPGIEM